MTSIPTSKTAAACADLDINSLGRDIANNGAAAHRDALEHIADQADAVSMFPGAVRVLRDNEATDLAQTRAFHVIARRWEEIRGIAIENTAFDQSLAALSAQWLAHQQLRDRGDIELLAQSGKRLSELRTRTRKLGTSVVNTSS